MLFFMRLDFCLLYCHYFVLFCLRLYFCHLYRDIITHFLFVPWILTIFICFFEIIWFQCHPIVPNGLRMIKLINSQYWITFWDLKHKNKLYCKAANKQTNKKFQIELEKSILRSSSIEQKCLWNWPIWPGKPLKSKTSIWIGRLVSKNSSRTKVVEELAG